jgi:hypothetical protein
MTYVKERSDNGFRTAKPAEFRANNAYNGYDFASRPQLAVERVAHEALAREKTLPKSICEATPMTSWPGLDRSSGERTFVRVRDCIAGAAQAERNCLSPAPARGDRMADPSPATTMK